VKSGWLLVSEAKKMVGIKPEPGTNILAMTERVEEVVQWLNAEKLAPQDISLEWVYDQRRYINAAIDLIKQNILIGGMLAVIVLLIFSGIYAFSSKRSWPKDKKLWLHAGVWGVIGLAIPMASFISSLNYQSSGVSSLLITLNVAMTVLLAALFLSDEPLNSRKILGMVIAFAGASLILIRGITVKRKLPQ